MKEHQYVCRQKYLEEWEKRDQITENAGDNGYPMWEEVTILDPS